MSSDVKITMVVRNADLAAHMYRFFERAKTEVDSHAIHNFAKEVDQSVHALLNALPSDLFWTSMLKLEEFYSYDSADEPIFELHFESVEYPYAFAFAEQVETWLRAIGCDDVFADVVYKYSQPTKTNLLNVSREYRDRTLTLFLGAGVSTEFGLPLWKELQRRIIKYWREKDGGKDNDEIAKKLEGHSLPEQARWLKLKLGSEFAESVKQQLYRDAYQSGVPFSTTAEAISKMENLRAVCTYNFDDLLEQQVGGVFKSVAGPSEGYRANEIPVYHVHGLLPFAGSPRGELIYSEEDYHVLANDAYHWANTVQINLLRECTCLLIGVSCTDPSLRRILDIVKQQKAGATYVIQKMETMDQVDDEALKKWSISKEFDRDRFQDLNVRTIWIDSYDEVPAILHDCMGH